LAILFLSVCSGPENPFRNPENVELWLVPLWHDSVGVADTFDIAVAVNLPGLVDSMTVDFGEGPGSVIAFGPADIGDTVVATYAYTSAGFKTVSAVAYHGAERAGDSAVYVLQVGEPDLVAMALEGTTLVRDSGAISSEAVAIAGTAASDHGVDSVRVTIDSVAVSCVGTTNWVVSTAALATGVWSEVSITAIDGRGMPTTWVFWLFKQPALAPPQAPATDALGATGARLSWGAAGEADRYLIERSDSGGTGPFSIVAAGIQDTAFTDTGLASGTSYWYRIRAYYVAPGGHEISDTSEPSAVDSVRTIVVFQKAFGDGGNDLGTAVAQTGDSGYIVLGTTYSFGIGDADGYLVRLTDTGDSVWTSLLQSYQHDRAAVLHLLGDGQYLVGLTLASFSVATYPSSYPATALVDASGGELWREHYGFGDIFWKGEIGGLIPTSDGGMFLVATADTTAQWSTLLYAKLTAAGDTLWARTFNPEYRNGYAGGCAEASDGGFVITGHTTAQVVLGAEPPNQMLLVKVNAAGDTVWAAEHGGNRHASGHAIVATVDGFVIAGETAIVGADTNAYVVKIDDSGAQQWTLTLGGERLDRFYAVAEVPGDGFVAAGVTVSETTADTAAYVVRLDNSGKEIWSRTYGGTACDIAYGVAPTHDGGFVVTGETESFGAGMKDVYVIKTDAQGEAGDPPE
jgi:hypothetical protein